MKNYTTTHNIFANFRNVVGNKQVGFIAKRAKKHDFDANYLVSIFSRFNKTTDPNKANGFCFDSLERAIEYATNLDNRFVKSV